MTRKCPNCSLVSPLEAEWCECGTPLVAGRPFRPPEPSAKPIRPILSSPVMERTPRPLVALIGYLLLSLSVPAGLFLSSLILPLIPEGTYIPRIAIIVPFVPFVGIAWIFLKASGQTGGQKVGLGAIAALVLGIDVTAIFLAKFSG